MDRSWAAMLGECANGEGLLKGPLKRSGFSTGSKEFAWQYKRRALNRAVSG
jgi:hypothetical protein